MKARIRMKPGILFALGLLACTLGATQAQAQELGNRLYDKFQVSASGSLLWLSSEIRIDAKNGSIGTDLDPEDDLGMPETKFQPRAAVRWRPGRKHELELGYQFARRNAEKTLERNIEVGDTSFTAGAQLNTSFDTDNAFLTYRFAFIADETKQIGVGLGLGAFFFDVGVDALAGIGSETVEYSGGGSFVGPTAALGVFGRFRLGDRWYLAPDVRYLKVTVDRFTGKVIDGMVVGQYYFSDKFGVEGGAGIKGVEVDVAPKIRESGIGPEIGARVKYTESQVRLGVVIPL